MSHNLTKLLSSGFMLLAACAGEGPTATPVPSMQPSQSNGAVVTRPAGGRCTTEFDVDLTSKPGFMVLTNMTGECNLRHLGRVTMVITQEINLTTFEATNHTTYVAANGDRIESDWVSVPTPPATPPLIAFAGWETYSGGTGRFAGVSGQSFVVGTALLDFAGLTGTGQYTSEGSITY